MEQRFDLDAAGGLIGHPTFEANFWRRYQVVFEEVVVLARAKRTSQAPNLSRAAEGVRVHAIPQYQGPKELLRRYKSVSYALSSALEKSEAIILRVPGAIPNLVFQSRACRQRPIGLEVVGDPWDVFRSGSVASPLRPILRLWFTLHLKRQCQRAACVSYVTREALQKRYPPGPQSFSTNFSSVSLRNEDFLTASRRTNGGKSGLTLITIGTMEVAYKGIDTVVRAVEICRRHGIDLKLQVIGEGVLKSQLETLAAELGISDRVYFLGWLDSRSELRGLLDRASLFVLGSRTEGLPRALLEAMARGLPCIATDVGGIPELLAKDDLVPPDSPEAMASKVTEFAKDSARCSQAGRQNLQIARGYSEEILGERRKEFYAELEHRTALWMGSRAR